MFWNYALSWNFWIFCGSYEKNWINFDISMNKMWFWEGLRLFWRMIVDNLVDGYQKGIWGVTSLLTTPPKLNISLICFGFNKKNPKPQKIRLFMPKIQLFFQFSVNYISIFPLLLLRCPLCLFLFKWMNYSAKTGQNG